MQRKIKSLLTFKVVEPVQLIMFIMEKMHGMSRNRAKALISNRVILVNRYLQKINSYHDRLHRFIRQFVGVSSSYLAGYLYLFDTSCFTPYTEAEEKGFGYIITNENIIFRNNVYISYPNRKDKDHFCPEFSLPIQVF